MWWCTCNTKLIIFNSVIPVNNYHIYSLIRRTLNFRRQLWQVSKMKISPKYPVIRRTQNYFKFCWPRSRYLQQFPSKGTKLQCVHSPNKSEKVTHYKQAMKNNRVVFLSICSLLNLLFRGNLEKLYSVARKYLVIRRTPSFEQFLIKQAYFLVKNGAPYKWINTVIIPLLCNFTI